MVQLPLMNVIITPLNKRHCTLSPLFLKYLSSVPLKVTHLFCQGRSLFLLQEHSRSTTRNTSWYWWPSA